jgi:hypothetical protein
MSDNDLRGVGSEQQVEPDETEQHDTESGRQNVPTAGEAEHGFLALQYVENREQEQVEDATAQNVTDGNVGRLCQRHGADAGYEFRQ